MNNEFKWLYNTWTTYYIFGNDKIKQLKANRLFTLAKSLNSILVTIIKRI